MRRALLAALLLLAARADAALAEDVPPAERAAIERALYLGQVGEARRSLAPLPAGETARDAAALLDDWRIWPPDAASHGRGGAPAAAQRLEGSWPALAGLWLERERRETRGLAGLPALSPLAGLDDPTGLHAAYLGLQREIYGPLAPAQDEAAAQAQHLRSAAYRLAALALGLLLALSAALALTLGARRATRPER